ncbi:unnamed protein product [Calicophoron daubneyi]|uniref:Protein quiver n=1 Tax=Calicophoron daubneyi TaxID=300641 RepID=A0AAV2SYG9_CALDB
MSSSRAVLACAGFLLLSLSAVESETPLLKCYQCSSSKDNNCNTPAKLTATNCTKDDKMCLKIDQKAPFNEDNSPSYRVTRLCTRASPEELSAPVCFDRVGTDKVNLRYCVCRDPGCNGANSLTDSKLLHVLGSTLVILWMSH